MTTIPLVVAGGLAGFALGWLRARSLQHRIRELACAAEALAAGDAGHRIPDGLYGHTRRLAGALEVLGARQRELAAGLHRLAEGDLSARASQRAGDALGQSFQRLTAALTELRAEIRGTTQAIRSGNLLRRGNAAAFQGEFREIVQGMNEALGAFSTPVDECARILEDVAACRLTGRARGEVLGDHARITRALNGALDRLDRTLAEISVAAQDASVATEQISAGSEQLARRTSDQAVALEEIAGKLQATATMTRQNAANAEEARNLAQLAASSATNGVESMGRLSAAIDRIKASSDSTARIVRTIDEIAFQTNLLALNAAVEAARAGDAGRGFAVVAEEVRSLAMRSAEAAKDTARLIEEAVRNADGGVSINEEVLRNLEDINARIGMVGHMVGQIAKASEQQNLEIDGIARAVGQVSRLTQSTAASSEESASAARELSSYTASMTAILADFELTRGSPRMAPRPAQAPDRGPAVQTTAQPAPAQESAPRPKRTANGTRSAAVTPVTVRAAKHRAGDAADGANGTAGTGANRVRRNGGKGISNLRPEDLIPFDDEDTSTLQEF